MVMKQMQRVGRVNSPQFRAPVSKGMLVFGMISSMALGKCINEPIVTNSIMPVVTIEPTLKPKIAHPKVQPRPCMKRNITPSMRRKARNDIKMCSGSANLFHCLTGYPEGAIVQGPPPKNLLLDPVNIRAVEGMEILSLDDVRECVTGLWRNEVSMKITKIDDSGIEIECKIDYFINNGTSTKSSKYYYGSSTTSHRVNFDGSSSRDFSAFNGNYVFNFSIRKMDNGSVNVSFMRPRYCKE